MKKEDFNRIVDFLSASLDVEDDEDIKLLQ